MSYVITSDKTELKIGTCIEALRVPAQSGDLIVFQIGKRIGIGRWYPDICGVDWIRQPGRLIACVGDTPVRIIGLVIPTEDPPKEITNLTVTEYATALFDRRKLKG